MREFHAPATNAGLRIVLQKISADTALSFPELSKCCGIELTVLESVLRESIENDDKPISLSTIRKIADGLGYQMSINMGKEITLQKYPQPRK